MTLRAKLDFDLVSHDAGTATFIVNTLSDHWLSTPSEVRFTGGATPATVGTSAVTLVGPTVSSAISTLVLKNAGSTPLRVAGMDAPIPAGRLAVLPFTASSVSIVSVSGQGSYTAMWVG